MLSVLKASALAGIGSRLLTALAVVLAGSLPSSAQWPQWGGPNRDFKVAAADLADQWPETGPRQLWKRELGDGYSGVVVDGGSLYTMYRIGDGEIVAALDADTGKTRWRYRYAAATHKKNDPQFSGSGPSATPLVAGDRLYTLGYAARLHCLDLANGKVQWSCDLIKEHQGKVQEFGNTASPLAYKDMLIVLVGGTEHGVVAFNLQDGSVAWKSRPFDISYASPLVVQVDGQDQFIFMSSGEVISIDPASGSLLWKRRHVNEYRNNCATPIVAGANLLYVSSHGQAGSRLLRFGKQGSLTTVDQVWQKPTGLFFASGLSVGDTVYGASGQFMFAQKVSTGEVLWKKRGFPDANCIYAGDKMIVLSSQGKLGLVSASPAKCTVHSTFQLLEDPAWTAPTIAGTILYARDRKYLVAVDLGQGSNSK